MSEEILLNQFLNDIPGYVQNRDYLRCLLLREKLYRELRPKLYSVVRDTFNGDWTKVARYNQRISPDGRGAEPSTLLIVIRNASKDGYFNYRGIVWSAHRVKKIRNCCYGHIPELAITDDFIRSLLLKDPEVVTFIDLIKEVDQLFTRL